MLAELAEPQEEVKQRKTYFLFFSHIGTIIQLELMKLKKDPSDLLMRGIQPALWLLIFGQTFSRIRAIPTGGVDYNVFLAPGILAQSITFISIFYGITIIWERDIGLLQKILTTPIRHSAFILGKMLAASLRAVSQGIIIILLSLLLQIHLQIDVFNLIGVLISVILGGAVFTGLSMFIATLMRTRERMMGIGQLITMPLFFSSNALYPLSIMPPWLQVVATLNPMSYLVDSLRILLVPSTASSHLLLDWGVLILFASLLLFINTGLFKRILNG